MKLHYYPETDSLYIELKDVPGIEGDRKGQYSIRINDQFRVCFVWTSDGPDNVEITDYH